MIIKMKHSISKIVFSALALMLAASCENAEYKAGNNLLYFADAVKGDKSSFVAVKPTAENIVIPVTVRLAQKHDEPVTVRLKSVEANLEEYNKNTGSEFSFLPADKWPASEMSITIPAGEVKGTYEFSIPNFDMGENVYALPFQFESLTQGDVPLSEAQGKFIYILRKPLVLDVPVFTGYGAEHAPGSYAYALPGPPKRGEGDFIKENAWGIVTQDFSLEAWVWMSAYGINNQAIFRSGTNSAFSGVNEQQIFVRFGDAITPYNYLQLKMFGSNAINTPKDLVPKKWYHWAFTFSSSDNVLRVYRNGDLLHTEQLKAQNEIHLDFLELIVSGSRYFQAECMMSQLRFWKTCRTAPEIKNNMYFPVNHKNPDLIASWTMNESIGEDEYGKPILEDKTGNGHNIHTCNVFVRWEKGQLVSDVEDE